MSSSPKRRRTSQARSISSVCRPDQARLRPRAAVMRSPRHGAAPTRRFSRTVRPPNTLACWKVRTMPCRATTCGRWPTISRPSKRTDPRVGLATPLIRLITVDLPAPFGPIRPVIVPRRTSKVASCTARTPPKWQAAALAPARACGGPAHPHGAASPAPGPRPGPPPSPRPGPPRGERHAQPHPAPFLARGAEHPLALGKEAVRPEPQEYEQESSDGDPVKGVDEPWGAEGREVPRHLEDPDGDEERAERAAREVALTAHDQRGEEQERLGVQPARGPPGGHVLDEQPAAQAGHRATGHQDGHPDGRRVPAERRDRALAVAHRAEQAAVR